MRTGAYDRAWSISAANLSTRDPATRDDPRVPYHRRWVWDGRNFDGRHVLVRCYHGLGDTLQFARYLPLLSQRATSVAVEVQPGLIPLLRHMPGITLMPFDPARPLPPSQCDMEITELDFALRGAPEASPPPYVQATRALLPRGTIAVCHGAGDWDGERSIPESMLAGICAAGPSITLMPGASALPVLNPAGCPLDMEVTASLVAAADLVITVDTMIAHLAGALCRPTWLLLKAEPDWRWNPARRDSPWYPTMRLYAQRTPGDWGAVIAEVERDLTSHAGRTMER